MSHTNSNQEPLPDSWEDQADVVNQPQQASTSNGYNLGANEFNPNAAAYYQQQQQQPVYGNQQYYANQGYYNQPGYNQQGYGAYPQSDGSYYQPNYNQQYVNNSSYDNRSYYQNQQYDTRGYNNNATYNKRGGQGQRPPARGAYQRQPYDQRQQFDDYNRGQPLEEPPNKSVTLREFQQQQDPTANTSTNNTTASVAAPAKVTGPAKTVSLGSSSSATPTSSSKANVVSLGGPAKAVSLSKTPSNASSNPDSSKDKELKQTSVPSTSTPSSEAPGDEEDRVDTNAAPELDSKPTTPTTKKKETLGSSETVAAKKPTSSGLSTAGTAAPATTVTGTADATPDDEDQREHVNIVFIGHVDAGKSTMGGHIL